jgi:hypothetical protein
MGIPTFCEIHSMSTNERERDVTADGHLWESEMVRTVSGDAPAELTAVVDELLNSLSARFSSVSSEIFSKSTSAHYQL